MSAGPYADAVLAQILEAGRRERRRRRGRLAGAGAALVAAISGAIAWQASPVAADVEIRIHDGVVEVRFTEDPTTPEQVVDAFADEGLFVDVDEVPAGPSDVGRLVTAVVFSAPGVLGTLVDVGTDRDRLSSFTVAEDWDGTLTISLGREAGPGERYSQPSAAFAPGEPLHCADVLGRRLRDALPELEGYSGRVQPDAERTHAFQRPLHLAVEEFGDRVVVGGIALSEREVLLELDDRAPFEEPRVLTLDPPVLVEATRTVRLSISSTVVRLALVHVAQQAGWQTCRHDEPCGCLTLADRCSKDRPATVLVVRDAPAPCQEAISAVLAGHARSVILWNEPEALTAVFEAIRCDSTVLPNRVITLATEAPVLTARQTETIRLLASGRSNAAIAVSTSQSLSTAKRDIADLLQIFDVPNRAALISAATNLGFAGPRPGSAVDYPTPGLADDLMSGVPEAVQRAFAVEGEPEVLLGGMAPVFRFGDCVLKRVGDPAEAAFIATTMAALEVDEARVRVHRPRRALDGGWIVDGWSAWEWVDGAQPDGPAPWSTALGAVDALHEALAGTPPEPLLDACTHRWARADRAAWGELELDFDPRLARLRDRLAVLVQPAADAPQLVHSDLNGNLLFHAALAPAVIDFSPVWRPPGYARGIYVVDALLWRHGDEDLVELIADHEATLASLARAGLFRLGALQGQIHELGTDITPELPVHELVVDRIVALLR